MVERDNIVLDGAGYTIKRTGGSYFSGTYFSATFFSGIFLDGRHNITIKNTQVEAFHYGIWLLRSSNNTVSGNKIIANDLGVYLHISSNNIVSGNVFVDNGLFVESSYNNVVLDNFVNGKPLVYLEGVSDVVVEDAGQVILVYCKRIRVENLNLSKISVGIQLLNTNSSIISGNNIINNRRGVYLYSSSNNNVSGNNITNNNSGIFLWSSANNNVSENNITAHNWYGVDLSYSSNNTVSGNNIIANHYGVYLYWSSGNMFYHNNFINNTNQMYFMWAGYNVWDAGYPSGGNYWSDYTGVDYYSGPNQDETGSDGIGDTPYIIDANNRDRYPLMNPWGTGTPIAVFSWSPSVPLVGEIVTFDASASISIGGEIVSYEWDFGDGNHASGKIVTHTYASAGYYTVTLNVTDSEGLWDIEQKQIEVKSPPPPLTVSITPTQASMSVGQSITFNSTVSGGYPPYTYQWYLNNAPVSGATSNTWTFTPTTAGIYYVHLKITDVKGNTAQSNAARITVATVPVGGYSIPIQAPTTNQLTLYLILTATLTIAYTKIKHKTKSNHKNLYAQR